MHVGQDFPNQSVLVVFWQDFASLKSLMKISPDPCRKPCPHSGAAEVLTPEPCRVWAQSSQELPLEVVHRLQCFCLHVLFSHAQALRGLSVMWPPQFPKIISLWRLGSVWFMWLHLLHETAQKMAIDLCALAMPVWFLKEGFQGELCLSPGHLLGWPVPFPFRAHGVFLPEFLWCYWSCPAYLSARMMSLFLPRVSSLCWYGWVVIRPAHSSISAKRMDGDSEAFHSKSWFPVIMAHFWTLFSSFYSDFVTKTRHNTPGCCIG